MFIPLQTLIVTVFIAYLLGMISSFILLMNILLRIRK